MTLLLISRNGDFRLQREGLNLLELTCRNWFSGEVSTEIGGNQIHIKRRSVWYSSFDIYKNDENKGNVAYKWNGNVSIRLRDDFGEEKSWRLKQKRFWGYRLELTDDNNNVILAINPKMNWAKLNYDYEIEVLDPNIDENQLLELITYSGFGARLYMKMIVGAG